MTKQMNYLTFILLLIASASTSEGGLFDSLTQKMYKHQYVLPGLNIKEGKARVLVVDFVSDDQLLAGMPSEAVNAMFIKQIIDNTKQISDNFLFILRSVDIDYDVNLQKTRDKLLQSVLGVPYPFTRSELAAFTDADAILFVSANLVINDSFGSKKIQATITNPSTKKKRSKKISFDGRIRMIEWGSHVIMIDPSSTVVFFNEQDSGSASIFSANKTYDQAKYGGEVSIDGKYLRDLPPTRQTMQETLDQIAQPLVKILGGEVVTVKIKWDKSNGDNPKKAWKALNNGNLKEAEKFMQAKLAWLTGEKADGRIKKAGKDEPLRAAYNNLGLIAEVAENFEVALEYRKMAIEAFKKGGGSKIGQKAVVRINNILSAREAAEQSIAQWDVKRQEAIASIPE